MGAIRAITAAVFMCSVLLSSQAALDFDWTKVKAGKNLNWIQCYSTLQCARLEVPLDYSAPQNGVAGIAIVKFASTSPKSEYRGPILFNPGGPGGSGVDAIAESGAAFGAVFGEQFDIVGFDPRGISYSTPTVSFFKSDAERAQWQHPGVDSPYPSLNTSLDVIPMQSARAQLLGTLAKNRDTEGLLQHITTDNVARDMLRITEAFGFEKLQYWGISYGTVLGATFATLFPEKVGRIIIDGVMDGAACNDDPTGNITNSMEDTDATLQTFFDGCAASGPDGCAFYAPTSAAIAANLTALGTSLLNDPIPVITNISYGVFSYTYLRNVMFTALYTPLTSFALLAQGLAELTTGNATLLYTMGEVAPFECARGSHTNPVQIRQNSNEASLPTACGDGSVVSDTVAQLRESYETGAKLSSFWDMFGNWRVRCSGWKVHREGRFLGPMGASNTSFPLLVIGNTADPVTPLSMARKTSGYFQGSVLLTLDAPGHTSIAAVSTCISTHMRQYFQNGTLPDAGTVCSADDELFPSTLGNKTKRLVQDLELLEALRQIRAAMHPITLQGLPRL
ncbi:TAP-like protein-domain-containing protein [Mycena capillaripes]|nr:TAP-like protein-domain-containing protein [Mycena capillaripes]